jgi:hypothetical protein
MQTRIVSSMAVLALLLFGIRAVTQTIPPGTALPVMLSRSLDVRHDKAGKTITARVMQDVPLSDGAILPKGTRISGQVISASPANLGLPSRLVVSFDQVVIAGRAIPITAHLRALASAKSVFEAKLPTNSIDDYGTATSDWNTVQIGGAGVYRGNGQVVQGDRVVGRSTDYGAVTAPLMAVPQLGCHAGGQQEQALWRFSPWACGIYGYGDLKIKRKGAATPVGEIELESQGNIHIEGGSGWLLRTDPTAD